MKKTLITIGITLGIFAAIGSFIFLGVTIYNFNNSYMKDIGNNESEDNNQPKKAQGTMAKEAPPEQRVVMEAMKLKPAITAIVNEDKKAMIIDYMEYMKSLKDKQSGYIAYFNHEENQLAKYKLPNLRVPNLDDLSRPEEVIIRQEDVLNRITDNALVTNELVKIHNNLLESEKNLLTYHKKMGTYLASEDNSIMDEALAYFTKANFYFRLYKVDFKALCDTYGVAFDGNWKEMFPEAASMGFAERSSRDEEASQTDAPEAMNEQNIEANTVDVEANNENQSTEIQDETKDSTSFSNYTVQELTALLLGKWKGNCPENKGDDLNVSLEFTEDLTYTKVSGGLVYTGSYRIIENNVIEFTNKTRGDDVLEVNDANVYTAEGHVLEEGKITFTGNIRRLGGSHGNYIFTKN